MNYTAEQQAIRVRMGELAKQRRAVAAQHHAAQAAEARHLIDAVTALTNAMNYSAEIGRLSDDHTDAFCEFLDTLKESPR